MVKFVFLSENKTETSKCKAEHGLSILIENDTHKILFDTGFSDLFYENSKALGVTISDVDFLVTSHGHSDHTDGHIKFAEINKKAPIYIHKDSFKSSYGFSNNIMDKKSCGISWTKEEMDFIKDRLTLTDGTTWITENIVISGTIPDYPLNIIPEVFMNKLEDGNFVEDNMSHEQFLAIKDQGEVYLFSGCSHKGIIPAIKYAKELFDVDHIKVLVAGMHLYEADESMRKNVVAQILEERCDIVMPVHCTGLNAIIDLKVKLGDRCKVMTVGSKYGY